MTKRFVDIEIGADIGQIRLYTTDEDYETYGSEDILNLLNALHEEKEELIDALNQRTEQCDKFNEENKRLQGRIQEYEEIIGGYIDENEEIRKKVNDLHEESKALKKEIHLMHMRSMFSTVKSFKGDLSKRYKYDEETDTIYDTANHYGQYDKILDKKEIVMLLNEYNTLLGDVE